MQLIFLESRFRECILILVQTLNLMSCLHRLKEGRDDRDLVVLTKTFVAEADSKTILLVLFGMNLILIFILSNVAEQR